MGSSKYSTDTKTKKWGMGIFVFSIFGAFSGIATGDTTTAIAVGVLYLVLAGVGFYLWTSQKPSDYVDKRSVAKRNNAEATIQASLERLKTLNGVKAVLAFEELQGLVKKTYKNDSSSKIKDLLESIDFDPSRIDSEFIGAVTNLGAGVFSGAGASQVRVYKDWVVAGKIGFDFDVSTRGDVTLDGAIQYGKNNQKIDNRKAALLLATQDWSHSFAIHPDQVDEARRILSQLLAIVEQLKPQPISAADLSQIMENLVSSSGKSPAEKLEELSNLRYQRLLSDKEFDAAKQKILGI